MYVFFVQEKLITSSACYFTLLQATLQIDKYVIEIRIKWIVVLRIVAHDEKMPILEHKIMDG